MTNSVPSQSHAVIVGGGIIGCSIAYHLAKLGLSDVTILEQGKLTCGSSWHAAGLIMQLRPSHILTELCRYGAQLLGPLKDETGQDTGFKQNGSLPIAREPARFTEIKRLVSLGKRFGVEAHLLGPGEVKEHYPLLDESKVVGGAFIPGDGQANPVDATMAFAKGAQKAGVKIVEGAEVTGFKTAGGAVRGVITALGEIDCEIVVLCAGAWSRHLGKRAGVEVPLYASEHMYVTTEASGDVPRDLPVLRDTDGYVYVKEDAGKLVVGAFEPNAKPLPIASLPERAEFLELPENWDQFQLPMTRAMEMLPILETLGIRHFMNGPESFTPDNQFIMGEAPNLRKFFVAAGFNSQGILSSAGVGKAMAEWIVAGQPTMDLSEVDIARFHPFQTNRRYLYDRLTESPGLLYAMHWPHRQVETARPVRLTPLHSRLDALGAVFGEAVGWERANWYAPQGVERRYEYSYGRQNWFPHVAEEHRAVREAVGLFDLSSFGKALIQGRDAERELQHICSADVARPVGKVTYTHFLNERGGIEADLTITRLAEDKFLMVTAAAAQHRDMSWVQRHLDPEAHVTLTDVTSGYAVLSLMGPRSRDVLSSLTDADLSNDSFPFGTAREIEVGYAKAWALRVTFVGELGWELYLPTEFAVPVFDLLVGEGKAHGLRFAGYHALDTLRSEKGYRHWGHDVSPEDTPLEAGLSFVVARDKEVDFLGRAAIERQREEGIRRRLIHVLLNDPEPLLFHNEPIYRNDILIGRVTSGAFGYTLGRSVGMGYIDLGDDGSPSWIEQAEYEIEIAGERFPAEARTRAFYDPKGERVRA
jgi:4-methylaminobutanoate oxidase (formaldehyde-forming)